MNITDFHRYNRLVRRGLVDALVCSCGNEYVLRATEDGDPLLNCLECSSMVQPGMKISDRVKAVNKEWYT